MGKKRQYEDEQQPPPRMGTGGPNAPPRRPATKGILDDEDIPRPKKVKPQNLEKLTLEELHQRKHDLKQEENYQNMVMSKKKRGPYSASDIRATYTQVLRFQYLQKEVDLEIERRDARKEKQAEQKREKKEKAEEAQRARRAALLAAEHEASLGHPGVAFPPRGSQFQDFHTMQSGASSHSGSTSDLTSFFAGGGNASASSSSAPSQGADAGFYNTADASATNTSNAVNPMMMMAQMMLETQKKLKEAQEKMMKVQDMHGR